ncbi:hypothetical protein GYMLUDRAFT_63433 [Collybiopsis luxurians FD-317 M1]|uniref:Uncharacterized protein n=1 Tax=Collybiopsis luxurians FD-317 M1 TaxID=944289 RepID=A0A0D0BWE9_9AGAR|nr:hypothetical protein GYMLUDRAFT_63433 [Collybiopsis luxurians FD-317 M1]
MSNIWTNASRNLYSPDVIWYIYNSDISILHPYVTGTVIGAYMYTSLINHFGDTQFISKSTWAANLEPAFVGVIGGLVQSFYGWRLKIITRSRLLSWAIFFGGMANMLLGIGTAIGSQTVRWYRDFPKIQVVVIICELYIHTIWHEHFGNYYLSRVCSSYISRYDYNVRTGIPSRIRSTDTQIDRIIRFNYLVGKLPFKLVRSKKHTALLTATHWEVTS